MGFASAAENASFPARIEALKAARKTLGKLPGSLESIHRLTRALTEPAFAKIYPEVAEAAHQLEKSRADKALPALDRLLVLLEAAGQVGTPEERLALLILEADPHLQKLLETLLSAPDRDLHLARTGTEALEALRDPRYSLIVIDLTLPDIDGRDFLVRLKERPVTARIPVVVLSALAGPQPKSECFALGADAYLEKPVAPEVLKAAVSSRLHKALLERREMRVDSLTGLPNRAAFLEAFPRMQSLSTRRRENLAVAFLDFDKFAAVNARCGHSEGDAILTQAMRQIQGGLRRSDFAARWGSDEMALLLPHSSPEGAVTALQKAAKGLRREGFQGPDGIPVLLSFCAGVARLGEGEDVRPALHRAWNYMRQAKGKGQNTHLAEPPAEVQSAPVILLALGEEMESMVLKAKLQREGFELSHCPDGRSVLMALGSLKVRLCVIDLRFSPQSGLGLLAGVRSLEQGSRIPVLLLCGRDGEAAAQRGMELGADGILYQPCPPGELVHQIKRMALHG